MWIEEMRRNFRILDIVRVGRAKRGTLVDISFNALLKPWFHRILPITWIAPTSG
jgi:hypothetical protein